MRKVKRMRPLENARQDLINLLGEHRIDDRCDRIVISHLLRFDAQSRRGQPRTDLGERSLCAWHARIRVSHPVDAVEHRRHDQGKGRGE
jgi:hypothetical protein